MLLIALFAVAGYTNRPITNSPDLKRIRPSNAQKLIKNYEKIVHLPEKLARRCIAYWGTPILKNMRVKFSEKARKAPKATPSGGFVSTSAANVPDHAAKSLFHIYSKFRTYDKER